MSFLFYTAQMYLHSRISPAWSSGYAILPISEFTILFAHTKNKSIFLLKIIQNETAFLLVHRTKVFEWKSLTVTECAKFCLVTWNLFKDQVTVKNSKRKQKLFKKQRKIQTTLWYNTLWCLTSFDIHSEVRIFVWV